MGRKYLPIPAYDIEIVGDWPSFERRWSTFEEGRASPFQRTGWLRKWYAILAPAREVEPCLVAIRDSVGGSDVLLLPLVVRSRGPLRVVEFADLGMTDYNAPLLSSAFRDNERAQCELWPAILNALGAYDAVRFLKMPPSIRASANPLAQLAECRSAKLRGWSVHVDGGWSAYTASLPRTKRKELERSGRLFDKAGAGRFFKAANPDEARGILSLIDECQLARLDRGQNRHVLRSQGSREFYEAVIADVSDGSVVVAALELNGRMVAGLIALADRPRLTLIRIGNRGGDLARIGLGRLLIWRTMEALHREGFGHFDFSIGDGAHKLMFGASPHPLYEVVQSTSLLGMSYVAALRLKEGWANIGRPATDPRQAASAPTRVGSTSRAQPMGIGGA